MGRESGQVRSSCRTLNIPVHTWETDLEMVLLEGALLSHLGVGRMVCIWMGEEEADFAPLEIICLLAISSSILLQLPGSRLAAYQGGMLALKEDFHEG